ncbi:MAG: serine hydrolase [Flavicella sp.]
MHTVIKIFKIALGLWISTLLGYGQKQQKTVKELHGIENEIKAFMATYQTVGLSVAVVKNDDLIYAKGFGYRNLEAQLPVTENTLFPIASMTKAFSGALLGVLVDQKKLTLKDKPSLYVPNFEFYSPTMNQLITIEDLLSHKSGIGGQGVSQEMFPTHDKLEMVQRLQYLKPQAEIKNSWKYSNIGYTLVGTIAEQVTGESWDKNIRENILLPLEMYRSCTSLKKLQKDQNFALGYGMLKGAIKTVPYQKYYAFTPAGALKSSAEEMSHWMRVWLNKGKYKEKQVIPKFYIQQASRPQNIKYNEDYTKESYLFAEGFGWRIRSWNGHYRLRHGGNTTGFSCVTELFPMEGLGVVVLCNQQSSILPYIISDIISRKMLHLPSEREYPTLVTDIYTPTKDSPLNKDKMPTVALKAYEGTYHAKGFGDINIVKEKGKLSAQFPSFTFTLGHVNYDSFYLKGNEDFDKSFDPEFRVSFEKNEKGEILLFKIHAQKEPIVFYRKSN